MTEELDPEIKELVQEMLTAKLAIWNASEEDIRGYIEKYTRKIEKLVKALR